MTDETFEPVKPGEPIGPERLQRWRYACELAVVACEIPRCTPENASALRAELAHYRDLRADTKAWTLVKSALECRRLGLDADARRPCELLYQHALGLEREILAIDEEAPRKWGPFRIARRLLRYRWN
jgi:hypothetical protein